MFFSIPKNHKISILLLIYVICYYTVFSVLLQWKNYTQQNFSYTILLLIIIFTRIVFIHDFFIMDHAVENIFLSISCRWFWKRICTVQTIFRTFIHIFSTFRNRWILTLNIEFKHIIKENSKGISKFRTQKDINEKW